MRWRDVYWRLWHGELHLPPRVVDEMVLGEIMLALDDDTSKKRVPEGYTPRSQEEMVLQARKRARMTVREKLERARRG